MILLNLDTCIPIIEISIYNIWYIFVQWGRLFYNEYIIVWWSWRRNWGEAKGYEGNILEENDGRLIWECFCKNKRNLMLPFVKWKACAFCSRAIAYIKTQLHWTSLNNFAFTNDVNKKDFRQNNTSTIFPFHQLFNSKLYTYIWMFKFAWG